MTEGRVPEGSPRWQSTERVGSLTPNGLNGSAEQAQDLRLSCGRRDVTRIAHETEAPRRDLAGTLLVYPVESQGNIPDRIQKESHGQPRVDNRSLEMCHIPHQPYLSTIGGTR
jgi:hypothetical protein